MQFMNKLTIKEQKNQLRKSMREARDKMSLAEREVLSEKICAKLWAYILKHKVQVIHSYLPMDSEVNVKSLLQKALDHNIKVVTSKTLKKRQLKHLKVTDLKNMEEGIFGTYHPKDAEVYHGTYDLILVAGLAFDGSHYRLGYGGGYYDTFLAEHEAAKKIGVCFPFQVVEKVPIEEHDVQLDSVFYKEVKS